MFYEHSFWFISFLEKEQTKNAKASLGSIIPALIRALNSDAPQVTLIWATQEREQQ